MRTAIIVTKHYKQLQALIGQVEGGKSQLKAGNINEMISIFADISIKPELLMKFMELGLKRKDRGKSKLGSKAK